MSPESTKIALNDIDQSLLAIEKTFTYMDDLSEELRIDSDEWHSRKLVVEKGLVRPLRTYRAQLMPLHYKEQRRLNKMIKSSDEVGQAPSEATDGKKRLTPALDRLMQP